METGIERVSTSAYTRIGAEAQIGAKIKRATEKLSAEGKEVTSIQQEQPYNGAVFWTIHANISWRKPDPVVEKQPAQQVAAQPQINISSNATIDSLIKRVHLFLEDKEFDKAKAYCENILDQDPECAEAYLGLLLSELEVNNIEDLYFFMDTIKDNKNFIRAKQFAEDNLKEILIDIEQSNTSIQDFGIVNGVLKIYRGNSKNVIIPNTVKEFSFDVFYEKTNVENIFVGENVIKITNSSTWVSLSIKRIVVSSKNQFFDSRKNCNAIICTPTNSLTVGCDNTVIVEGIERIKTNAFMKCRNIKNLEIPSSVKVIEQNAFYCCESIERINASNNNEWYDSRNNCNAIVDTKTSTIILGCQNTVIPEEVKEIASFAFYYCNNLQSMIIPNGVTRIGEKSFYHCSNLCEITIPDSVQVIDNSAFSYCSSLSNISANLNNKMRINRMRGT